MSTALAKDYIDLKIDVDRMTNGKELAQELRGTTQGGIPWMVILDAQGKAIINADGPEGNIGCPVQPAERAHFMAMIRKSRQHMSDEDVTLVESSLEEFAQQILSRRKR